MYIHDFLLTISYSNILQFYIIWQGRVWLASYFVFRRYRSLTLFDFRTRKKILILWSTQFSEQFYTLFIENVFIK